MSFTRWFAVGIAVTLVSVEARPQALRTVLVQLWQPHSIAGTASEVVTCTSSAGRDPDRPNSLNQNRTASVSPSIDLTGYQSIKRNLAATTAMTPSPTWTATSTLCGDCP